MPHNSVMLFISHNAAMRVHWVRAWLISVAGGYYEN